LPTPVSALIHAATMVTAGVYLLIRTSPLLEYSSTVLILCLWLGAITTVFSSLIGLFQQDIKKVIAYSTMSQLAQEYTPHSSIFRHQTIYAEAICKNTIANSQITKARDYNRNNFKFFNSSTIIRLYLHILCGLIRWRFEIISKLVGISEAIRLILVFIKLKLINLIPKSLIFAFGFSLVAELRYGSRCFNKKKKVLHFPLLYDPSMRDQSKRKRGGLGKQHNFTDKILRISPNCLSLFNNRCSLVFSRNLHTIINTVNLDNKNTDPEDLAFRQWLAGIIDGDGYFLLSKNGYNSCEITMDARDKKVLYLIQHKYGGSIKQISNAYAFKYKLRNKAGLIALINDINGLIRNPTRLLQMNKLCVKFNIELKYANNLTFNDGWLSGFIDSDGSIYYSESSGQVFISISQKNKYLLEPLIHIYGGRVDITSPKIEAFKYVVYRKAELFNLIDNYFSKYPLRTEKMKRVNLIKQFYLVRLSKKNSDVVKFNEWVKFKDKWEKYED